MSSINSNFIILKKVEFYYIKKRTVFLTFKSGNSNSHTSSIWEKKKKKNGLKSNELRTFWYNYFNWLAE